jgi:hypothetical protein
VKKHAARRMSEARVLLDVGKRIPARDRFAPDSPLEESGFEPLVPLATEMLIELARGINNAIRMLAVGDIGPVPRLC